MLSPYPSQPDGRRLAPAAERNLPHILAALARHAPASGRALEIASGTGQQIPQFAAAHPGLMWQATDRNAENMESIRRWAALSEAGNLLAPVVLDAGAAGWGKAFHPLDLIVTVNLLHLVPVEVAEVMLAEASAALGPAGVLLIYGPFLRDGKTTSEGDAAFDASLRAQDAAIGYKDVAWVTGHLAAHGLSCGVEEMPANNLMINARRG